MLILRPVREKDLADLMVLAKYLDTINFPNDREKIEDGIALSMASFSGKHTKTRSGVFQFVLEDTERKRVLAVSKILATHGTKEKPHYYWQISWDVRESKTLGIGMKHQVLKLAKDSRGSTEIAGIIVHPEHRGKSLGKQIFYARFLFMALHQEEFLGRIVSELLPPLDKEERSALWEAYGRKFTGLTYQEADQLSQDNKEFIETLFPLHDIYTCLLPVKARTVVGKVGPKSLAAKALAEKNGFRFLDQIDPFDGGPHFGCKLSEVTCIKNSFIAQAQCMRSNKPEANYFKTMQQSLGLVALADNKSEHFLAIESDVFFSKNKKDIFLEEKVFSQLKIKRDDRVAFLPYA